MSTSQAEGLTVTRKNEEDRGRQSSFDCNILRSGSVKDLQSFESMNSSHDWTFKKSDGYGKSGILVMCHCTKCGAEKVTLTVRLAGNTIP